jgi:pimeloyl-ACP methyl ester carboxylesterase
LWPLRPPGGQGRISSLARAWTPVSRTLLFLWTLDFRLQSVFALREQREYLARYKSFHTKFMSRIVLWIVTLGMLFGHSLQGSEIVGQWQGTLAVAGGLRIVLRITKAEDGALTATLSSIDQSPEEFPVPSISFDGSTLRFSAPLIFRARYEGIPRADGTSINGQWFGPRTPGSSLPLDFQLATGAAKWQIESTPHTTQFVTVDDGVKLEVLDWGGTGRPLVLLAGLGNTAHIFDKFAAKLTATCHVYGITRRGFGASSAPEPKDGNYSADRLGDDVLEVIDFLKLNRPVLVGHSIAGEELSSIGSRHPEKVSVLIYLDAGYSYAFYDQAAGDLMIDAIQVQKKLARRISQPALREAKTLVDELLQTDIPQLVKGLEQEQKEFATMSEAELAEPVDPDAEMKSVRAVLAGQQKYTAIKCPVLAFFAIAPLPSPSSPDYASAQINATLQAAQIKAFEAGVPSARVVVLPNADHYVFRSNEADVLRDLNDFLAKYH